MTYTSSADYAYVLRLIEAYESRRRLIQLVIALLGEQATPLPILAEYHEIEAEINDLTKIVGVPTTESSPQHYALAEGLSIHREDLQQKEAKLATIEAESEINRDFFDRIEELEKARIAGSQGRMLLLDAPAGFGKTRFLLEYIRTGQISDGPNPRKLLYRCVSFRDVRYCTASGFLDGLITRLETSPNPPSVTSLAKDDTGLHDQEYSIEELFDRFTQILIALSRDAYTGIVLILEDAHCIRETDFFIWLRDYFISELRERLFPYRKRFEVSIIVIGRFINVAWSHANSIQLQITIPPFDVDDTREILRQKVGAYSIDLPDSTIEQVASEICHLAAGHPRSVMDILHHLFDEHRMAIVLDRRHPNYFFRPQHCTVLFDRYVRPNLKDVLKDLAPDFLREAYTVLAVFRSFFGGLINTLQEHGYIDTQLKPVELLDKLRETGYITRPDTLGFYKDAVLRPVVALQIRIDSPDRFRVLNEFAWQYWNSVALKNEDPSGRKLMVNDAKQVRCILEALYHYLVNIQITKNLRSGMFDSSIAKEILEELIQQLRTYADQLRSSTGSDDLPALHSQLEEMLKADHELENEVYYLLGSECWNHLIGISLM